MRKVIEYGVKTYKFNLSSGVTLHCDLNKVNGSSRIILVLRYKTMIEMIPIGPINRQSFHPEKVFNSLHQFPLTVNERNRIISFICDFTRNI